MGKNQGEREVRHIRRFAGGGKEGLGGFGNGRCNLGGRHEWRSGLHIGERKLFVGKRLGGGVKDKGPVWSREGGGHS